MMSERYLGDGLYASWDGCYIMLRAPREGGDHWVGIELPVWRHLVEYANQCFKGEIAPVSRGDHVIKEG